MYNNNDQNYIFINLSHVLLKQIILNLENIDRICLSLVCKRFFQDRNRYLVFNSPYPINTDQLEHFHLKSFKDQFDDSCEEDTQLYIFSSKLEPIDSQSKYSFDLDTQSNDEFKIEDHITSVSLIDVTTHDIENISKLLQDNLQPHFKLNLILNEKLLKQGFKIPPHGIKDLIIDSLNKFELPIGLLPQSLETLDVWNSVLKPFIPGALPSSLHTLRIRLYSFDLEVGTLPPRLTVLELDSSYNTSNLSEELEEYSNQPNSILPETLTSLSCPSRFLPQIKSLPALRYLSLYLPNYPKTIDLSTSFPESLTELRFDSESDIEVNILVGTLPPNITRIDLSNHTIHSGLFSASTHYEEVTLKCINLEPISSNIQIDRLILDVNQLKHNFDADELFPNNKSIKKLEIFGEEYRKLFISLPSSVEELDFQLNFNKRTKSKSIESLITPSLRKIKLNSSFVRKYNFFSSIPSSVNTFSFSTETSVIKNNGQHKHYYHFEYTLRRINSYEINDNLKKQHVEEFLFLGGFFGMEGGIKIYIYSDDDDDDEEYCSDEDEDEGDDKDDPYLSKKKFFRAIRSSTAPS